jgi:MFS family permease
VQVSPTSVRGTLGSLNQLMICLGILAALLVNVALPVTDWRLMFNLAAAPAIILLLGERTGCITAVVLFHCLFHCLKLLHAERTG